MQLATLCDDAERHARDAINANNERDLTRQQLASMSDDVAQLRRAFDDARHDAVTHQAERDSIKVQRDSVS